jgi:hypothetical protein
LKSDPNTRRYLLSKIYSLEIKLVKLSKWGVKILI